MRIYLLRDTYSAFIFVAKDDEKGLTEKTVTSDSIGEMNIFSTNKTEELIPKEAFKKYEIGILHEITDLLKTNDKLKNFFLRRQALVEFSKAIEKVLINLPIEIRRDLEELNINIENFYDLSLHVKWADGENDSII